VLLLPFVFSVLSFFPLSIQSSTITMHYLASLLPLAALSTASRFDLQVPIGSALLDQMPLLGFGTWNLDRSNASAAVSHALQTGYRHIDCAAIYGNEPLVGKGLADGVKKAGLAREDIWVTSKLWNDQYVFPPFSQHPN